MTDAVGGHALRRVSDPYDYRLVDPRFRLRCACGWEAPGWFGDDQSAFIEWSQHVNESEAS